MRCVERAADALTKLRRETAAKIIVETTSGCCSNLSTIGLLVDEAEGVGVCLDIAQLVAEVFQEGEEDSRRLMDNIIESLPPNVWAAVELTHIHGWEIRGRRVLPHRYPSDEQIVALRKFLRSVFERTGRLVVVFEVFYDTRGNAVHSWELSPLLREIARGM